MRRNIADRLVESNAALDFDDQAAAPVDEVAEGALQSQRYGGAGGLDDAGVSPNSVSELRKKPASQRLKSAGREDLIITSKGQPVAVLLRIATASVQFARSLLRSVRAIQVQTALQQAAAVNGTADLTLAAIAAEIAAARRARRQKSR